MGGMDGPHERRAGIAPALASNRRPPRARTSARNPVRVLIDSDRVAEAIRVSRNQKKAGALGDRIELCLNFPPPDGPCSQRR